MSTTLEVRNRKSVVVYTTNLPELAFKFADERNDLGDLTVWEVRREVYEIQMKAPVVIPIVRGARGLQAGRGRS